MSPRTIRRLLALHRWCGVLVSANLLVLAVTGLILIFHEEIDHALGVVPEARGGGQTITLARAVDFARSARPGHNAVFLYRDPDEFPGMAFVGLAPASRSLSDAKPVAVDLHAGTVAERFDLDASFTGQVLKLHAELFAGPIGRLLVGVVALAFVVSLVSGTIVYGPMMKRFAFGLIRRGGAPRATLADLHKLFGIATLGWTFVVAATGLMLSLGSVLLQVYSMTELAALGAPYASEPIVERLDTLDEAVQTAERTAPGRRWSMVALPGSGLASPRHFTVLLQGSSGLEAKVLTMVLADAREPSHAEAHELPVYLKALLVSEPLHFGNYGGLPLKLVWALFALATVFLSGSGAWVFLKAKADRAARLRAGVLDAPVAVLGQEAEP